MLQRSTIVFVLLIILQSYSFAQDKKINLSVRLNSSQAVEVNLAKLKYDKEFAFSFTFDDALIDAFELAFKLFHGGYSSVDGHTYAGLYYTDGCGNQLPFSASIAWYTNNNGQDIHNSSSTGHLTWSHASQLYHSGWMFLNHSFNHSANTSGIDYDWQISQNNQAFYQHIGYHLNYVIPPGGDENYIQPAFDSEALAVFTSNSSYAQSSGKAIQVDNNMTSGNPVFWRKSIESDSYTLAELKYNTDTILQNSSTENHLWWNEFTHRIQYDLYSGSVKFEDFRGYMEYLESKYGAKGNDIGLFANSIEVFEYLVIRDLIQIKTIRNGNLLKIELDYTACPDILRYYDISLLVSGSGIQSIESIDAGQVTYAAKANHTLVNIDLPESHFSNNFEQNIDESDWLIYPNPARNYVQLTSQNMIQDDFHILLFDALGHQLATHMQNIDLKSVRLNLNAQGIKNGSYFLIGYEKGKIVLSQTIIIE